MANDKQYRDGQVSVDGEEGDDSGNYSSFLEDSSSLLTVASLTPALLCNHAAAGAAAAKSAIGPLT